MRRLTGWAASTLVLAAAWSGCGRDGLDFERQVTLRIVPSTATLFVGQTFRFDVVRTDDEGATSVLGAPGLELSVSPPSAAEVVGPDRLSALAPGRAELRAALDGREARIPIEIVDATLEDLAVEPASSRLAVGAEVQLSVTGRLSDGRFVDLTDASTGSTYESANAGVATVDPSGLVTAIAPGDAVITINQAGASATANVTVTPIPDDLRGIRVEPDPVRVEPRGSVRLLVIGIGSRETILPADRITFLVRDADVASVDEAGVVRGRGRTGATVLRAELADFADEVDVFVEEAEAQLVGLRFEPDESEIRVDEFVQLALVATFDDGLVTDVSSDSRVSYRNEGDPGTVDVNATGRVIGRAPGEALVVASFLGREARATVRVVGNSPVEELIVVPSPIALEVGESIQIEVIARLRSGEELDVTTQATFRPPGSGALDFDPASRTLTGAREGFGTFEFEFQGAAVSVPFAVVEGVGQLELRFEPNPIAVDAGQETEFQLFAFLPDGTSIDITFLPGITYTVDDAGIAEAEAGLVRGLREGSTLLRAEVSGESAEVFIDVVPGGQAIDRIVLSAPPEVRVGRSAQVRVIAIFTDGSGQDVTTSSETSIISSEPTVLSVTVPNVFGLQEGESLLTARYRGFEASRAIEVTRLVDPPQGLTFRPNALRLSVLEQGTVRVLVQRSTGATNVSGEPDLVVTTSREVDATPGASDIVVRGLRTGSGRVQAFYQGLQAVLVVDVSGSNILGLRIEAPSELEVGETSPVLVFAQLADGSEQEVAATLGSTEPAVADFVGTNTVEAFNEGETALRAELAGLVAEQSLRVVNSRVPVIDRLEPAELELNPASRQLRIVGSNFQSGDDVRVDGQLVTASSFTPTVIELTLPESLVDRPGRLPVQVEAPGGTSNVVFLQVGEPPSIDRVVPQVVVPGETVRIRLFGEQLFDLAGSGGRGWTFSDFTENDGGSVLAVDVTVPANQPASQGVTLTFRNELGSASTSVTTRVVSGALSVTGETRLAGTQVRSSLTIRPGGQLVADGSNEPLIFLVTGDVIIDGTLDARGLDGRSTPEPRGGDGGPGGAGGGAGGDGDATISILGGAGRPPGNSAARGVGPGSRGADGGGEGAGQASTTPGGANCGSGGGGGAAVGSGGAGADGQGNGVGGAGGTAPGASVFSAGAGGGGGNDCDPPRPPGVDSAGGSGGGGGGLVEIQILGGGTIDVDGSVLADGGDGGGGFLGGGGGGGGGGTIRLLARGGTVELEGSTVLSVAGGNGGTALGFGTGEGGGGGGGLIFLDTTNGTLVGRNRATLEIAGGTGPGPATDGNPGRVETRP